MAHRTRILELPDGKFTGICSCGWLSPDLSKKDAVIHTNDHVVKSLRLAARKTS